MGSMQSTSRGATANGVLRYYPSPDIKRSNIQGGKIVAGRCCSTSTTTCAATVVLPKR